MAHFENITLEKGMYSVPGKSFTQVLEELDSSENYRGTSLEGLDAFQRQLKRYHIKVSGPGSDQVEQFFASAGSAALFPEYVARAVRQGMERASKVTDLVATVTKVDGMDYRTIDPEGGSWEPSTVAEGAQLPQATLRLSSGLVKLYKRGQVLQSSYEALRLQKLDLFTVALAQVGAGIAAAQMGDAVDVLINGDGSKGGVSFTAAAGSTSLAYSDFLALWGSLAPYQLDVLVAGTDGIQKLLAIDEFKDAQAGLNFQGTGKLCTPLGATLVHVPGMAAGKIIALDKSCALEMVQSGDICVDSGKLIDRQLDEISISATAGFARIFSGAAQGVSYTTE
ncbi:MAG: phage major capsid protein [Acutalibacter sp.]